MGEPSVIGRPLGAWLFPLALEAAQVGGFLFNFIAAVFPGEVDLPLFVTGAFLGDVDFLFAESFLCVGVVTLECPASVFGCVLVLVGSDFLLLPTTAFEASSFGAGIGESFDISLLMELAMAGLVLALLQLATFSVFLTASELPFF